MKKIRILIVDDEPLMCDELQSQLEPYPEIEILAACHYGEEALARAADLKPDVIFLDIQMPGIDGMTVADVLSRQSDAPKVIFVTAHDEYAIQAFAVDALDYVLKPFDEGDIKRIIAKLLKTFCPRKKELIAGREAAIPGLRTDHVRKFCVQKGAQMIVVDHDQIQLLYAKDRLVFLQTTDGINYLIRFTLNDLVNKLDPKLFVRCHRNYIVNINQISSLETWFNRGYKIVLKDAAKTEIHVSRQYVEHLKAYLEF